MRAFSPARRAHSPTTTAPRLVHGVVDRSDGRRTVRGVRKSVILLFSLLALSACSSSNQTAAQSDGTNKTTETTGKPQPTAPLVTIAVGEKIPPGTAVVTQELPVACGEAVAGLRKLMDEYKSGFVLDQAGTDRLNKGIGEASSTCTQPDWERFYAFEFRGWLAPAKK